MLEEFVTVWERHWPMEVLAAPFELKTRFADRWVRFHCLPDSKRCAENESEYSVILNRYNTVLDDLFGGGAVYIGR